MATRQKVFSRSLIRSEKFWSLPGSQSRLFFVLVLLDCDNLGRTRGNKHYLKGQLYEKDARISADDCERFLDECHKEGILVKYEFGGNLYIQDPVHNKHNKIFGNMKDESIYPPPPKEVIEKYEQSFTKFDVVKLSFPEGEGKGEGKGEDEDINSYWQYFLQKTKKRFSFTPSRKDLLRKRIKEGLTFDSFKYAVDRFCEDDFKDRHKYMDLVYCIGQQKGKPDNLEKWLNTEPKKKKDDKL